MEVIFTEDIKSVGKKWDMKDVSDGYARNFLFPNKLAIPATAENIKKVELMKARLEKDESELKKHLSEIARQLSERSIIFPVKTSEEGHVFGSVTKEMILKGIRENKLITKEHPEIKIDHPLKELGVHEVEVDFKKGVKAKLKVILESISPPQP